jgi:hypothetical protein
MTNSRNGFAALMVTVAFASCKTTQSSNMLASTKETYNRDTQIENNDLKYTFKVTGDARKGIVDSKFATSNGGLSLDCTKDGNSSCVVTINLKSSDINKESIFNEDHTLDFQLTKEEAKALWKLSKAKVVEKTGDLLHQESSMKKIIPNVKSDMSLVCVEKIESLILGKTQSYFCIFHASTSTSGR